MTSEGRQLLPSNQHHRVLTRLTLHEWRRGTTKTRRCPQTARWLRAGPGKVRKLCFQIWIGWSMLAKSGIMT